MCGILGQISNSEIDNIIFKRALNKMNHRGPDNSGLWSKENPDIMLGHNRLSIIDLSANSHQPMVDTSGKYVITFNGEIYNYKSIKSELIGLGVKFKTGSDTEVLLESYKLWKNKSLDKLVGMFSFAIYDIAKNEIFLARDRAGEKPLFYYSDNNNFIFSSELKGLVQFPEVNKKINFHSLDLFLAEGYVPGDKCIIEGIKKMPAAHYMIVKVPNKQIRIKRYWQLPSISSFNYPINSDKMINDLERLISNSVKNQLYADVPIGVLLSGGLDSSLITAFAAMNTNNLKTFTIRFPKYEKFDETQHARLIADYFGTEHIELEAEESSIDLLPILAKQYDEPLIDSSMIPTYLVTKLVKSKCTVAIGGDGADELFGGYRHYSRLLFLQKYFKLINYNSRNKISNIVSKFLSEKSRGINWLKAFRSDFDKNLPRVATYFDRFERKKILNNFNYFDLIAEQSWNDRVPKSINLLDRATRMDFYNYLCEDILVKVDRASMLNSLEIRAPFLDYRIIDYAFNKIPIDLKTTHNKRKIILQEIGKKVLPREFDFNRKQGFNLPINDWFKLNEWQKMYKNVLLDTSQTIFNHSYLEHLLNNHINGQLQGERLFGLLMFELWRNEYEVKV